MTRRSIHPRETSRTFANGLQVIRAYEDGTEFFTVPQLARRTGLDRMVVRRLVLTLVDLGYLDERERSYSLTPRILTLGLGFLRSRRVGAALQPTLAEAARGIKMPISFAMRDEYVAVYVAHAMAESSLITEGFTIGTRLPLLTTGIGRAIAAFLDTQTRQAVLAHAPLAAHTANTCTSRSELGDRLQAIWRSGVAIVDGEFERGVTSVAVPVMSRGHGLLGSIGVAGAENQFRQTGRREEVSEQLKTVAVKLAALL